jgi:hypothetical protein
LLILRGKYSAIRLLPEAPEGKQKMPTLEKKEVNGVNVPELFKTIDAIKATPGIAKFRFRIRNEWLGCGYNRSTVAGFHGALQDIDHLKRFELDADEPPVLLGEDKGANPVEHLLHALAACVTTSMVYHAAAKGIELQEVESQIEGDLDLRGFLGLDPNIRKGYHSYQIPNQGGCAGREASGNRTTRAFVLSGFRLAHKRRAGDRFRRTSLGL